MTGTAAGFKVLLSALIAGTITGLTAYLAADPHQVRWPVLIIGGLLTCLKDISSALTPSPTKGNGS